MTESLVITTNKKKTHLDEGLRGIGSECGNRGHHLLLLQSFDLGGDGASVLFKRRKDELVVVPRSVIDLQPLLEQRACLATILKRLGRNLYK